VSTRAAAGLALIALLVGPRPASAGAADPPRAAAPAGADDLRALVEADWSAQEKRRGRSPQSPDAIRAVLGRAARVLDDLRAAPGAPGLAAESAALERLRAEAGALDGLDDAARRGLYRRIRSLARDLALKNPRLAGTPLLFMKRRRFVCQMLHEYLGYYYQDIAGGGVFVLEEPGRSLRTRDLLRGRLPEGAFTTLALSYDARTAYFAYADRAAEKPDFYDPQAGRRYFHIYSVGADGENLRALTTEAWDDFDPCPLPDGGLAFMSWRRGGFCRCNNPWEPIASYTLHRMDADGRNARTLSFHETNEWHPNVLHDGRIVYIRWDYVDRSAAHFHGLWAANPDGTNAVALFGNYTMRINACYQPRPIPGSRRIAFIAGAHHADVGGSLVLLDPARVSLDPATGQDRFDALDVLTPEVCFPEGNEKDGGWPKSYYHSPWPLSEDHFLISYSNDPIPGMSSGGKIDSAGIYYFDRFGSLELLYREPGISCMYPIPLAPRPVPPVVPSAIEPELGDEGEFALADVSRSLFPLPAGRPVKELRVFQILPKTTHIANKPRIGHANAESARMLLGTAPVEADGSAYFRAPARKPLYFQAVDAEGRAVQGMRSVVYLQPGERRGCAGCHEPPGAVPVPAAKTPTFSRLPSKIRPGPDGTRPFSFPRLVQPLLDKHCARCHDGDAGPGKSRLALTGEPAGAFSRSYQALKPFVRWYEWGGQSIAGTATRPGQLGADASPLTRILKDDRHKPEFRLADEEWRKLYIWLDGNAPFYGTYGKEEQAAQQRGEAVPPPSVQ
jgi:hypothetical protein